MGSNMARHLKDAGYNVSAVYDVNKDAQKEVADELGAVSAGSLGDVSANSDVVVTVVTDEDAMRSIFTGDDNLLQDAGGKVFINCATFRQTCILRWKKLPRRLVPRVWRGVWLQVSARLVREHST